MDSLVAEMMATLARLEERQEHIVEKVDETVLHVPNDPANRHYREVLEWVADGNIPLPADPPPPPPKSAAPLTPRNWRRT